MTKARAQLISLEATSYYHCVSRCVRRSFLCGYDSEQNQCFEHRRGWIEERLFKLAQVFCIDVCAYAIMSNHYHVVLHINQEDAQSLSDQDICERWLSFHTPPLLIQKWLKQEALTEAEAVKVHDVIDTWRERLTNISWFMRLLNQHIATQANKEDGCTGHFWEGRFKSQALLDEQALAAAMAYVDLNPIRANLADSPETSEYTSVKTRIDALKKNKATAPCLHPFVGYPRKNVPTGIPFRLMDYLELVDWTGRQIHFAHNTPSRLLPVKRHSDNCPNSHIQRDTAFCHGIHTRSLKTLTDKVWTKNIREFPEFFCIWGIAISHGESGCNLQNKRF